ncbi:TetR family transcriptional regulator C-terminal domain-containing protein [Saccharopolyspora sp. CA-218241]
MRGNSVDGLEAPLLTGGCLMTAAPTEYDDRPGRARCTIGRAWAES